MPAELLILLRLFLLRPGYYGRCVDYYEGAKDAGIILDFSRPWARFVLSRLGSLIGSSGDSQVCVMRASAVNGCSSVLVEAVDTNIFLAV